MKKYRIILAIGLPLACCLVGLSGCSDKEAKLEEENAKLRELAEMDRLEMENQYSEFARQYDEMMTQVNNDSLIAQLAQEQQRIEELQAELKKVKSDDAAEILRLKKELETLRQILRSYIIQIDSLNRQNEALTLENQTLKSANETAQQNISSLSAEKETLSGKVALAAQLDATGIYAQGRNKKGKACEKVKDVKKFVIGFNISRNVTASAGTRSVYVRISAPTGDILTKGGTFSYENRTLEYSIRKDIEYTGEEQSVTVYYDVTETLSAGAYRADIFADGNNIGHTTFNLK